MNNSYCAKCKLFVNSEIFPNLNTHPNAKIVVIGPFPTKVDEDNKRIFSDNNAKFFINQLQKIEEPFYLTNLVKCIPYKVTYKDSNKLGEDPVPIKKVSPPTPTQKNSCMVHCFKLLDDLKPKVILTVGSFVTNTFLNLGLSIDKSVGSIYFHPELNAYIVPVYDFDFFTKDSVYVIQLHKDLLKVKQLLQVRGRRKIISKPVSLEDPIEIKNYISELKSKKLVSFDLETTGLDNRTDRITDVSFCHTPGYGVHIKWSSLLPFIDEVKDFFSKKEIKLVAQNVKFDVGFLRKSGIEVHGNTIYKNVFDTMLAEHTWTMKYEGAGAKLYNLDRLSWVYTDEGGYKAVLSSWGGVKKYQDAQKENNSEDPDNQDKLTAETKKIKPKTAPKPKIIKKEVHVKPVARLPIYKDTNMFKRELSPEELNELDAEDFREEDAANEGINYACRAEYADQVGNALIEELMNRGRKPKEKKEVVDKKTGVKKIVTKSSLPEGFEIDEEVEAKLAQYEDFLIKKRLKTLEELDIDPMAYYAALDADVTLRVGLQLMPKIEETYAELYTNLITPLHFAISEMENTGIKLDIDYVKKIAEENRQKMEKPKKALFEGIGREFNINSNDDVRDVIYGDLKIPVNKKFMTKGGKSGQRKPASDEAAIAEFSKKHPILKNILEYRRLEKENSTYFEGFLKLVHEDTGRIYGSFSQTATATGRLSSSNPNLQNIPTEDYVRNMIIPSPGCVLLGADLSQAELRILAMISNDENMRQGFTSGFDFHVFTASAMFNIPLTEFDHKTNKKHSELRSAAKQINFGIAYGRGATSIAEQVGCSIEEAQGFMDKFFKSYPKAKQWINDTIATARKVGYVETVHGRRRYLPYINSSDPYKRNHAENQAINTPIQGTASDCASYGLVQITDYILSEGYKARPVMIIHDEIQLDCPESEIEVFKEKLPYFMTNIPKITIPLVADVDILTKWRK